MSTECKRFQMRGGAHAWQCACAAVRTSEAANGSVKFLDFPALPLLASQRPGSFTLDALQAQFCTALTQRCVAIRAASRDAPSVNVACGFTKQPSALCVLSLPPSPGVTANSLPAAVKSASPRLTLCTFGVAFCATTPCGALHFGAEL